MKKHVAKVALPINCTAIHHSVDLGVNAACKLRYRHLLLFRIIGHNETGQQKINSNQALREGIKRSKEGFDPPMLDDLHMVADSWIGVTQRAIALCWVK